jgi:DNA-binding LacI/PurR family transcriptional regulator
MPTQRKAAGRSSALRAAGLEPDGLVAYADFDVQGGRAALAELLQGDDPPTGVICSSDVMAIGVLQEAAERGLHVPRDLSVVGFDGIAAEWTQPRLTTIEQPIPEIAETAVEALRRLIEEPARPLPHFVFRPQLRLGGSTAPPAT